MIIDIESYKLEDKNYNNIITNKERIVIGNSFSVNMNHYTGWLYRYNGKYKKTAHYTISKEGVIYQHVEPIFYTNLLGKKSIDESSIYILIENEGWLIKKKEFINYLGYIYKKKEKVFCKSWKGYNYWVPYSEKQLESTICLVNKLINDFKIVKEVVNDNVFNKNVLDEYGVMYKSNIDRKHSDISPSWDFNNFKKNIKFS